MPTTNALDTLKERGFVENVSDETALRAQLDRGPISLYCGYDPTAPSLHMGHLVSIMVLAHFQRAGHRPIVVLGGGTGMIGDPSGKTETRQLLTIDQIQANAEGLRGQFGRFLDFGDKGALMVNNADWLMKIGYLEFLRDTGVHFSVNQLLQHSTYRERVAGEGLNFIELNYPLLQAYDFLQLYRQQGCLLQIGGQDQWFNILSGVDLIRRVERRETYALVSPLIMTSTGEKMGKTVAGAVWLDPSRTSPYDYYQYWINVDDHDVERFLAVFTFLPMDEVRSLGRMEGDDLRAAKERLAFEATVLAHGEEQARKAQASSRALFPGLRHYVLQAEPGQYQIAGSAAELLVDRTLSVEATRLRDGIELVDLLVETGLTPSKRAARDLIKQGGANVNGERVSAVDAVIDEAALRDGAILLRAGKKRFHRVVPE